MGRPSKKRLRKCCEGKLRFSSLKEAQMAAAGLAFRQAKRGSPVVSFLRAYGCPCGSFHYGKTRDINWDLVMSKPPKNAAASGHKA